MNYLYRYTINCGERNGVVFAMNEQDAEQKIRGAYELYSEALKDNDTVEIWADGRAGDNFMGASVMEWGF